MGTSMIAPQHVALTFHLPETEQYTNYKSRELNMKVPPWKMSVKFTGKHLHNLVHFYLQKCTFTYKNTFPKFYDNLFTLWVMD